MNKGKKDVKLCTFYSIHNPHFLMCASLECFQVLRFVWKIYFSRTMWTSINPLANTLVIGQREVIIFLKSSMWTKENMKYSSLSWRAKLQSSNTTDYLACPLSSSRMVISQVLDDLFDVHFALLSRILSLDTLNDRSLDWALTLNSFLRWLAVQKNPFLHL